jgi:hypothetical protein
MRAGAPQMLRIVLQPRERQEGERVVCVRDRETDRRPHEPPERRGEEIHGRERCDRRPADARTPVVERLRASSERERPEIHHVLGGRPEAVEPGDEAADRDPHLVRRHGLPDAPSGHELRRGLRAAAWVATVGSYGEL